ncbi:MAG: EamA family transporter [Selenomonadaceae bacterium]|nr:EamA family transporter [Selenomonadaceae bacterium]
MTDRQNGIACAVTGGVFWGGSGVAGQYLLQDAAFTTEWIVTVRLICGGLILLLIDAVGHHGEIFRVWKDRRNFIELVFFGIFGMMAVSYSYFASIRYGNAAAATVMQYLMPAMMVLYVTLRHRKLPSGLEIGCVVLAMLGTFFLVTHGDLGTLSIPPLAVFWGVMSAITGAIYTMAPKRMIRAWRASLIVGWGMFIGGIATAVLLQPPLVSGIWEPVSCVALLYLVLFGTVAAVWLYLNSTKYIQPSEAGVLASVEPLTAIILSVVLLGASFGAMDVLGSACILATVAILSRVK